jgi:Patatin-like phospholipase
MAIGARPVAEDANVFWIFQDEIKAINERRGKLHRPTIPVKPNFEDAGKVIDAVGLSLSGGGIRSAALCLGVLQALNHHDALRNIDYLSTVSGGGYIGSSLTATMTKSGGEFVFGNRPTGPAGAPLSGEISDTEAVGHIRNYSNYLIPAGMRDVVTGVAIVVRGLVANLGLLLPALLLLAAATIAWNPTRSSLRCIDVDGGPLCPYISVKNFGIALAVALVGLLLFFLWALYRSIFLKPDKLSEFRTRLASIGGGYLVFVGIVFFCELQPFVVAGMFDIADAQAAGQGGVFLSLVTSWVKTLAAIATPIAAVVMFFRQQFGDILKAASATSNLTTRLLAVAVKGAVWIAGAALPLLIWVAYLYLCYWGIINNHAGSIPKAPCLPSTISGTVDIKAQGLTYGGEIVAKAQSAPNVCPAVGPAQQDAIGPGTHTPQWLLAAANWTSNLLVGRVINRPLTLFYFCIGALLFVFSWRLTPNANSLHRLYRDRLSKAFLFDPMNKPGTKPKANETTIDQGRDFAPLDNMPLSQLSVVDAPYQLINAALNIQGSDYANRRGRNADFFLFSRYWVGSAATGYAQIEDFEPASPDLDLATAMAISGAAASSNMGANSIRPLTPTLALLNVRLGYWLKNPAFWAPTGAINPDGSQAGKWSPKHRSTLFLWSEISGRLYESADEVYLTDGGHIENLGIYELLRRRCRIIVAVDAEADSAVHFPSLITLQRYARIDLGVRIDLPWDPIQATTLALMGAGSVDHKVPRPKPACGPHVAIGTIDYGSGETGYLVYMKSSLTGDENDGIRDYARRNNRFPHESTGDQFFSEEQFEVYRALGFHIAHGMLSGQDCVSVVGAPPGSTSTFKDDANPTIRAVRDALTAKAQAV